MSEREIEKRISSYIPLPVCIINRQGKVLEASSKIGEVFLYDGIEEGDIFALTGIKTAELYDAEAKGVHPQLKRNGRTFRLLLQKTEPEAEESSLTILFDDMTGMEELKDMYRNEKLCFAKVQVDNYDELTSGTGADSRLTLSSEIDKIIRRWGGKVNASVNRIRNNAYVVCFEQQHLDKLVTNKFDILDEIRGLETGTDFPASLSIGVGAGGKTPAQTEEYADAALDLALGRGGDQAVVKRNLKIEYFGGKLAAVEKSNKGKSRIVGHALKQLITQSRNVFIMGHRNPDMDSFGAALGVFRLCELFDRKAYIVLEEHNEALQTIYMQARKSENYQLISREKAVSLANGESLVIVVDTHRPSLTECPQLLSMTERVAVIDHHRKMEESIENPTLAYMESYASSTCELVTEILLYMGGKKSLVKLEAEALLAGMTIDTNGFAVRTGVRTFEAAAWLRRQGADPTEVKRFFQKDPLTFQIHAQGLASARFFENGMAISVCDVPHADEQVICAQVADQLLTVKGVRVSFVLGTNGAGMTVVSARSLGDVNVQVIMEKFGGGGHLTMAATQLNEPKEDVAERIIEVMEEYLNDSHS